MDESRYFEDLSVGERERFGSHTLTAEEAINFAEQYDPQRMHVDRTAARELGYDDVVASPWLVVCLYTRQLVEHYMGAIANRGGRGIKALRFPRKAEPGAVITGEVEVLEKAAIEHRPYGVATLRMTAFADGRVAADWTIEVTVANT